MFFKSDTFLHSNLCWKHVYILIFGIKNFSNFSKGPLYDLGYYSFFRKIKNLKNTPNRRWDPLKILKKFLFQKSKCTHVSSINLKGKVSDSKNIVTQSNHLLLQISMWDTLQYKQLILGPQSHKKCPQNLLEMFKLVKKDEKSIPNEQSS